MVHIARESYKSANPQRAIELASKLGGMGFETVLLWGVEHWFAHQMIYGGKVWLEPMGGIYGWNM